MTPNQTQIFKAAYFAVPQKIDEWVQTESDLCLQITIPKGRCHWITNTLTLTVPQILTMNIDALNCDYFLNHFKTELNTYPFKTIFQNAHTCKSIIIQKFNNPNAFELNYNQYISFMFAFLEEEEWLNENDIAKALADGYRKIDLDLYNAVMKRNYILAQTFINQGANPVIDPLDKTDQFVLLDSLYGEQSFSAQSYKPTLISSLNNDFDALDEVNAYEMLEDLYACASSAKLIQLIEPFSKP